MSVYDQHNLTKVFAEIKHHLGKYNPNTWVGNMSSFPNDMNDAEKESIYRTILDNTDKHFKNRKPKSWQSLVMQVAVCLSTEKLDRLDQQPTLETRGRNRVAAYIAGFLTMADIIHLESNEIDLIVGDPPFNMDEPTI